MMATPQPDEATLARRRTETVRRYFRDHVREHGEPMRKYLADHPESMETFKEVTLSQDTRDLVKVVMARGGTWREIYQHIFATTLELEMGRD